MIVYMSRRICVALYERIIELRPGWHSDDDARGVIKIVMTGAASDPPASKRPRRSPCCRRSTRSCATWSRYAIVVNPVRGNMEDAREALQSGDQAEADRLLIRTMNALAAFSDRQQAFDRQWW